MKKIITPSLGYALPVFVLVRPQLAENIGMVARAMMNCAIYDLRLVCPRENHLSDKAISASSGAAEILEKATVYKTLEEAIADMHFVLATTARPRGMTKDVFHPTLGMATMKEKLSQGQKCAVLFGAERTGLENHEIIASDGIIEIPLNPLHSSLNLSQAALLVGYEWLKTTQLGQDNSRNEMGGSHPATKSEVDNFLKHLENELELKGHFRFFDKKERMKRNLRNIFTRNALTSSEIKTLYGVINDLTRKEKHD